MDKLASHTKEIYDLLVQWNPPQSRAEFIKNKVPHVECDEGGRPTECVHTFGFKCVCSDYKSCDECWDATTDYPEE